MAITISGTTGVAGVDGSASAPSTTGTDSNSGIFYAADAIKFSTGGTERIAVSNTSYPRILQVANVLKTDSFTTTDTGITNTPRGVAVTGLTVNITPSSSSNKILVRAVYALSNSADNNYTYSWLYRGTTLIGGATIKGKTGSQAIECCAIERLDSPASTSAQTYSLRMAVEGNTGKINDGSGGGTEDRIPDATITVMEIAA